MTNYYFVLGCPCAWARSAIVHASVHNIADGDHLSADMTTKHNRTAHPHHSFTACPLPHHQHHCECYCCCYRNHHHGFYQRTTSSSSRERVVAVVTRRRRQERRCRSQSRSPPTPLTLGSALAGVRVQPQGEHHAGGPVPHGQLLHGLLAGNNKCVLCIAGYYPTASNTWYLSSHAHEIRSRCTSCPRTLKEDWKGCRAYVIANLPQIKQLDGQMVLPADRIKARRSRVTVLRPLWLSSQLFVRTDENHVTDHTILICGCMAAC